MKKLVVVALATMLVAVFTLPAAAVDSQFGGYFRSRMWTAQNFSGEDKSETWDVSAADLRTRLYYTAVFHENLKFVNKFEFDATYGSNVGSRAAGAPGNKGYGTLSADGANIEIKNSYIDFNPVAPLNIKLGTMGVVLSRGFLFDDDFSGAIVSYNGEGFSIPFIWMKANEGGQGMDAGDFDVDIYALSPSFTVAGITLNPVGAYITSDDVSLSGLGIPDVTGAKELDMWYAGLNVDAKFNALSLWFTGLYQGGDVDTAANVTKDFAAYLAALGGTFGMNWGDIHGQAFYASGDDDPKDNDIERFFAIGQSYYWSEIAGLGRLGDTSYSSTTYSNFCGDHPSDIMAANLGVTVKPMDKLKVAVDAWYVSYAEDRAYINQAGAKEEESYIGTELNLVLTYEVVKGLNLDLIGAYMFAGDALTRDNPNDADPYEVGTRLTLSF
jgi:hypothetical protein